MSNSEYERPDGPIRADRYVFFIGPAYDDLAPVFVVDSRDYPSADAAVADRIEASDALQRARIITEVEVESVPISARRLDLPTWQQWRVRAFPGGEPGPELPIQPTERPAALLAQTIAQAMRAGEALRDELLGIAHLAFPAARATVTQESGAVRWGRGRVGIVGEQYGNEILVTVRQAGSDGQQAMAAVTRVLVEGNWQVGAIRDNASDLFLHAQRSGSTITAAYNTRWGGLQLLGKTAAYEVVADHGSQDS